MVSEAKTVLYKRKLDLEQRIRMLKTQEASAMRELKTTRDSIRFKEKKLQEVIDVGLILSGKATSSSD